MPLLRLFILEPTSGIPIYRQLIDQVRRMVLSGQLVVGTDLPSVREVAAEYTVNPTTISKAYSLLESEGLLHRNRGKPMTIADGHAPHTHLGGRLQEVEGQVDSLVLAARQLNLNASDLIDLIKQKMGDTT